MPRYRLNKGMHFELEGKERVVEQRLRNGDLLIRTVISNEFEPISETLLLNAWVEGQFSFIDNDRESSLAQHKANKTYIQELSLLRDDDPQHRKTKKEFHRRRKYVMAVITARLVRMNATTLQPIIDAASRTACENDMPDPNPPAWKTVLYRWVLPFKSCSEDFRVLIPGYRARGNRKPKFTGVPKTGKTFTEKDEQKAHEITELISEVKEEKLAAGQRCSISSICDDVLIKIQETNEFRSHSDKLPQPDESSIYSFFDRNLDEYEKDLLRHGKHYADLKYRETKPGPMPTRPLERTEMDHTPIDLLVIDTDVMLPIGRPKFTSEIDVFTKMDLGFWASFNYPGYLAVMKCLKHAILPKTYVRERYPSVQHDWPCYGIPETVVVDNAPEFHGESFEEAAAQLGFNIQYGPKGEPWYRPTIERAFRTKNTGTWHRQPGTTFSNILDKGDYNPQKHALASFDDFMEMAHIFMIDIYPRQHHRGIKVDKFPRHKLRDIEVVPALLWEKAIKEYPPTLPPHRDELQVLIGEIKRRVIFSYGIDLDGLTYNSESLAGLRRRTPAGEQVVVKRDPDNISLIYVADEKNGLYFPVPAVNQEYTRNLTLWQHKKIKAFARQRAKDTVNIDELLRAKQVMQEIIERDWKKLKKTGPRQRMANFRGIVQEDYKATGEQPNLANDNGSVKDAGSNILRLNPEAQALGNISDISCVYVTSKISGDEIDANQSQSNIAEGQLSMSNKVDSSKDSQRAKKRGSKAQNGKTSQNRNKKSSKDAHTINPPTNDQDLDMSGYSANFNLPK